MLYPPVKYFLNDTTATSEPAIIAWFESGCPSRKKFSKMPKEYQIEAADVFGGFETKGRRPTQEDRCVVHMDQQLGNLTRLPIPLIASIYVPHNYYKVFLLDLAFKLLVQNGCEFNESTRSIWESIANNVYYASSLCLVFKALGNIGCHYSESTHNIWWQVINIIKLVDLVSFSDFINQIASMGYQYDQSFHDIFFSASRKPPHSSKMQSINKALQSINHALVAIGIRNSEQKKELFIAFLKQIDQIDEFIENLLALREIGCEYKQSTSDCYCRAVNYFFNLGKFSIKQLPRLLTLCFYEIDPFKNQVIFDLVMQDSTNNAIEALKNTLISLALEKRAESQEEQGINKPNRELIQAIFSLDCPDPKKQKLLLDCIKTADQMFNLPYGPLEKTDSTKKVEELLKIIAEVGFGQLSLWTNLQNEHELTMPDSSAVNLTLLLKNANMSHFTMSDDIAQKLDKLLLRFSGDDFKLEKGKGAGLPPIAKLPMPFKRALYFYILKDYFEGINCFFRGDENKGNWHNKLAAFILGCLSCAAINRLPGLLDSEEVYVEEKKILAKLDTAQNPNHSKLSRITTNEAYQQLLTTKLRANIITEKEYLLIQDRFDELWPLFVAKRELVRAEKLAERFMRGRQLNVWTLPALTSTSSLPFNSQNVLSKFISSPSRLVPIEPILAMFSQKSTRGVQEVLLSPGLQVVTIRAGQNKLLNYIVCSPLYQPPDEYWPDHALRFAHAYHVNTPYKDQSSTQQIGEHVVHRPNHNLVHTFRVMLYLPYVVVYFSHHAKAPLFRRFCREMTKDIMNWLKIAAAFLVTGRESEIGFQDDPDRYKAYKAASAQHFRDYVQQKNPLLFQVYEHPDHPQERLYRRDKKYIEEMNWLKNCLSEVICYRGDPDYLESMRQEKTREEFQRFSYLQYILSMAHNLDLARCYDAKRYQQSLASHDHLIQPSVEQRASLTLLQYFAIKLMKAHGDRLCCDFNERGEWVDRKKYYQLKFGRLSHSIKELSEETATVPVPEIFPTKDSSKKKLDSKLSTASAQSFFSRQTKHAGAQYFHELDCLPKYKSSRPCCRQ